MSHLGVHTCRLFQIAYEGDLTKMTIFALIYITIYADVGGWAGLKSQKHADVILEWSLGQ